MDPRPSDKLSPISTAVFRILPTPRGSHLPSVSFSAGDLAYFLGKTEIIEENVLEAPPDLRAVFICPPLFFPPLREEAAHVWSKVCPSVRPPKARPAHLCGNFLYSLFLHSALLFSCCAGYFLLALPRSHPPLGLNLCTELLDLVSSPCSTRPSPPSGFCLHSSTHNPCQGVQ